MSIAEKLRGLARRGRALLAPTGLRAVDMIAMGCIMATCFFLFQFGDLDITVYGSYGFLEGHFLDFNRYNADILSNRAGFDNYYLMPMFLPFAIWNIPMKLLGLTSRAVPGDFKLSTVELAWNKLLLVIFLALCSIVVYKIARFIADEGEQAKLCAFLFVSNPLTIYVIFIFGGFDILSMTLVLLGLYAFLRRRHWQFILWFMLAVPCKFFALIPFIPLLLLGEKNIWKILRGLLVVMVPTLALIAQALLDSASKPIEIFGRINLFGDQLVMFGSLLQFAAFILAYVAICLFAYFRHTGGEREFHKYAVFLPYAAFLVVFFFMAWQVQWVILLTPFLALAFLFTPSRTYSLLFEVALTAAMIMRVFVIICPFYNPEFESYLSIDELGFSFFPEPAAWAWDHSANALSFLGNFWVHFPKGYDPVRGFFQPGIFCAGKFISSALVHNVADVLIFVGLLSPFFLQFMHRKKTAWPTPGFCKTQAGYLRLRMYGGLAVYFLPLIAVGILYTCFPIVLKALIMWRYSPFSGHYDSFFVLYQQLLHG